MFELWGISVEGCSERLVEFGLVFDDLGGGFKALVLLGCCQGVGVIP